MRVNVDISQADFSELIFNLRNKIEKAKGYEIKYHHGMALDELVSIINKRMLEPDTDPVE